MSAVVMLDMTCGVRGAAPEPGLSGPDEPGPPGQLALGGWLAVVEMESGSEGGTNVFPLASRSLSRSLSFSLSFELDRSSNFGACSSVSVIPTEAATGDSSSLDVPVAAPAGAPGTVGAAAVATIGSPALRRGGAEAGGEGVEAGGETLDCEDADEGDGAGADAGVGADDDGAGAASVASRRRLDAGCPML